MFRTCIFCLAALSLAACGGGNRTSGGSSYGGYNPQPVLFATGPIYKACQQDRRKAASRSRCGCVQAVADQSLSSADQKRGAKYFKDPGKLQEVRQSDNAGNERFWKAWKAYGQTAAALCRDS
ncbi:hypothetical protein [Sulfitobacter aestuariivivens]|uniref:Arginine transporter n=1 Tax=Sulfitobacter aestuariivivens TaxID=2766981 RepID=A0A927D3S6_9RHOB|nr:hypothetical protein [Sulfitobacter aestuariivivens]MBD3664578.1 hypothetical protein [Sulfitobacter aestuariivivens]